MNPFHVIRYQWLCFILPGFSLPSVYGLAQLRGRQSAADQTYDTAPPGLRGVDPMTLGQTASQPLFGLRVAVVWVHFEGNLGDEMETTPFLKQLYDWGIAVDAYSAPWKDDPSLRLHSRASRPLTYVKSFSGNAFDHAKDGENYDVVIVAPGPVVPDICAFGGEKFAFGVSGIKNQHTRCLKFIWTREVASFNSISPVPYPTVIDGERVMLSADLSYSFEPIPAGVKYWQAEYENILTSIVRDEGACIIVVSRANGTKGVRLGNGFLEMSAMLPGFDGIVTKVSLPITKVVFASSDPDVDRTHFEELERHGVNKNRLILLNSIEQMFGLFTATDKVQIFSDRYHPAVAGHILGRNVTVLGAISDSADDPLKMTGLNALLTTPPAQLKKYNAKSFASLHNHLLNAQRRDRRHRISL